jgi:hypothetical protein
MAKLAIPWCCGQRMLSTYTITTDGVHYRHYQCAQCGKEDRVRGEF